MPTTEIRIHALDHAYLTDGPWFLCYVAHYIAMLYMFGHLFIARRLVKTLTNEKTSH